MLYDAAFKCETKNPILMVEICNQRKDQFGALLLLKCFSFLLIEFLDPTSQLFSFSVLIVNSYTLVRFFWDVSFRPPSFESFFTLASFSAQNSKGNAVWHKTNPGVRNERID
jgi:hypothetical protein